MWGRQCRSRVLAGLPGWGLAFLLACALMGAARQAGAAETVHLYLKANGVDIKGDSTQSSLGREGSIECVYFEAKLSTLQADGVTMGTRQYKPLLIRKRIDKSSPLLYKALVQKQPIVGVFKFFRPSPTGDGTTEQFYTITIQGCYISSIKQFVPDTIAPASSMDPPLEEVTFNYTRIAWVYTNGNIGFEDNVGKVAASTGVAKDAWSQFDAPAQTPVQPLSGTARKSKPERMKKGLDVAGKAKPLDSRKVLLTASARKITR
jgi:type VI secretion system secreted protein Hcp